MTDTPSPAYGTTRRLGVTYAEVERTAIAILKDGRRPTIENVRAVLQHGSPDTLGTALKRFWRDLGVRAEGDPAALTRLPAEIAALTDGLWQRALALAGQAAKSEHTAAHERLAQVRQENALRAQSFTLREQAWDATLRTREQAFTDAQDQLRALMSVLASDRALLKARDARIAALEAELDRTRQQRARKIARTVTIHRALAQRKPARAVSTKPKTGTKRKVTPKRAPRPARSTRRPKR